MLLRKALYMPKIMSQQWYSKEKIKSIQNRMLKDIINHATKNSKFYRKKLNEINISNININNIHKIPITSKDEVRNNTEKILTEEFDKKKHQIHTTSGSSGNAINMVHDNSTVDYFSSIYARNLFAMGYKPWDRITVFYYAKNPEFHEKMGIMKKIWISSTLNAEDQFDILKKSSHDLLMCYPSTMKIMGRMLKNDEKIKPKLIVSFGEMLYDRTQIEKYFDTKVFDFYGAEEFHNIASECEKREGLHINSDSVLVETIKDGESVTEEKGDIVVTGLVNKVMPLIRYKIGDVGKLTEESCSCGRNLPLMKNLEGRNDDFITLPSGKQIGPRIIVGLVEKEVLYNDELDNYRVVQKSKEKIIIYYKVGENFTEYTLGKIDEILRNIIDEEIDIDFIEVENIEANKRGKLRFVVSEVK